MQFLKIFLAFSGSFYFLCLITNFLFWDTAYTYSGFIEKLFDFRDKNILTKIIFNFIIPINGILFIFILLLGIIIIGLFLFGSCFLIALPFIIYVCLA